MVPLSDIRKSRCAMAWVEVEQLGCVLAVVVSQMPLSHRNGVGGRDVRSRAGLQLSRHTTMLRADATGNPPSAFSRLFTLACRTARPRSGRTGDHWQIA